MRIEIFRAEHLRTLRLQSEQQDLFQLALQPEYGDALEKVGPAFSVLNGERAVACIGVQEHHALRAEAWALLGDDVRPFMRPITRAVRGWLDSCHYRRIEANVATDFEAGHRWATLLGFEAEGMRRAFWPDGRDAVAYVRIKECLWLRP